MSELIEPRVLREYAFIADGERGALVGPDGTIAWMCAPRWDSPAVFAMPANPRRCVILRRIEAADGPAKVSVTLDLRALWFAYPLIRRERAESGDEPS